MERWSGGAVERWSGGGVGADRIGIEIGIEIGSEIGIEIGIDGTVPSRGGLRFFLRRRFWRSCPTDPWSQRDVWDFRLRNGSIPISIPIPISIALIGRHWRDGAPLFQNAPVSAQKPQRGVPYQARAAP